MRMRSAVGRTMVCVTALALCFATDALAQQKQKVSYKVGAQDSKYTQRHMLEVGDELGHQVGAFEIHRAFKADAPVVNGVKVKEIWTRGYSDYVQSSGLSVNYTTYVMENGDKFYAVSRTMGQADANGKRTTVGVGEIRGGTGKFVNIRGTVRANGVTDGKAGYNESQSEIEYWLAN